MGVSVTTVHRALQGKDRVSDETRETALRLAAEMGYRANYMAAALKRKGLRFAVVLPEPTGENRFYYRNLWQGAKRFLQTVAEFHVEPLDIFYPLSPGANGIALQGLYEQRAGAVDGVLTVAVDHPQSAYFLEKLSEQGVPVALVGADLHRSFRFCCVKSRDEMAGQMAAELLTAFHTGREPRKVIVTGNLVGSLTMPDQYDNSGGFEQYLRRHAPWVTVLHAFHSDTAIAYQEMCRLLREHPDTDAAYSCSARHTVQMCRAAAELGLAGRIRLIGNDRFAESDALLEQGVLTAIIDKRIRRQSHLAMQALFDYKVKGEYPAGSTVYVEPAVILRSHLATP